MAGVSIGDVLALINLTRQIATAIRSCTTAEDDYKSTTAHLDFILHVAETLREAAQHGTQQDEHLQRYLEAFEDPIQRFLERMRKCEPLSQDIVPSGRRRTIQRLCRRGSKRMRWALTIKDDAAKLQASLMPQFTALTMYMQARSVLRAPESERNVNEKSLSCEHTEPGAELLAIDDRKAVTQTSTTGALAIRVSIAGVKLDLVADSRGILQSLEAFLMLLMDIWKLLHLFFLTSAILPRGPSMLLDSNIQVEDALGRKMSLPLDQCRSWKRFTNILEVAFRESPGELKVRNRNFGFLASRSVVVNYANWHQAVRAGLKITMVMYIQRPGLSDGTCPNCGTAQSFSRSSQWTTCRKCNVTYNISPARPTQSLPWDPAIPDEPLFEDEYDEEDYEYMTQEESQARLELEEKDTPLFKYVQWFDSPCSSCSDWTSEMFAQDGQEIEITCDRCCTTHLF